MRVQCNSTKCSWNGKFKELENHHQCCLYVEEKCPHGCGQSYPRCLIRKHRLTECPLQPSTQRWQEKECKIDTKYLLILMLTCVIVILVHYLLPQKDEEQKIPLIGQPVEKYDNEALNTLCKQILKTELLLGAQQKKYEGLLKHCKQLDNNGDNEAHENIFIIFFTEKSYPSIHEIFSEEF